MDAATLLFPDYPTAVAAAQALGFWQEVIIEEPLITPGPPDENGWPAFIPVLDENNQPVTVAKDYSRLNTQGQTIRPDGSAFSWFIDEIGQDPVVIPATYDGESNETTPAQCLSGYAVNAIGELPELINLYRIPYGAAGRVFCGTDPEAFTYEPASPGFVTAQAA